MKLKRCTQKLWKWMKECRIYRNKSSVFIHVNRNFRMNTIKLLLRYSIYEQTKWFSNQACTKDTTPKANAALFSNKRAKCPQWHWAMHILTFNSIENTSGLVVYSCEQFNVRENWARHWTRERANVRCDRVFIKDSPKLKSINSKHTKHIQTEMATIAHVTVSTCIVRRLKTCAQKIASQRFAQRRY